MTSVFDAVVIGAGCAGIAAARTLQRAGQRVLVLEARGRIGGRAHSVVRSGRALDMGATWVHGHHGNPMASLARRHGRMVRPHDDESHGVYDAFVGAWLPRRVAAGLFRRSDRVLGMLPAARHALGGGASWADGVDWALDRWRVSGVERARLRFVFEQMVELDYAGPSTLQSLAWMDEDQAYPGADCYVDGGVAGLLEAEADGLDVRLRAVVRRVRQGADDVRVDVDGDVLVAARCVVTAPLGVLKTGAIAFEPDLPAPLTEAMARLGVGTLEKLVFGWETPPKTSRPSEFLFIGAAAPLANVVDLASSGAPGVRAAFAGGERGRSMAQWSDVEAEEHVARMIRRVYGAEVPAPDWLLGSRWTTDPFSIGSYTFIPVGASRADLVAFTERWGRLSFAGEHTAPDHYGTLHGAWDSGVRAANQILDRTA